MPGKEKFLQAIKDGYAFKGEAAKIGVAMLDGEVIKGGDVILPLKNHESPWINCRRYGNR